MNGKDVFVSLPTGSGKSLCYSILPLAFDNVRSSTCSKSIVPVVSPLIALMKEQVLEWRKGVSPLYYSGDMDDSRRSKVCQGEYQLIFMSPERLLDSAFWHDILRSPVYQKNVVGFAVDKAHCVVKWYVKQHLFSVFNMVAYFLF